MTSLFFILFGTFAHANCDFNQMRSYAMIGDTQMLSPMIQNCPQMVNHKDHFGDTLLHVAANYDSRNVVVDLLQRGARANTYNDSNVTPLHLARSVEVAKQLIGHGAKVNAVDTHNRTPFRTMMELKNFDLLDLMRTHGAQIRHADLDWASDYYEMELLNYMADEAKTSEIRGSGRYFRTFFFYEEDYRNLARKLILKGGNLNVARTIRSRMSLLEFYVDEYVKEHQGYRNHGLVAIEFLLRNGATANVAVRHAGVPLMHYILRKPDAHNNSRIIQMMIETGANIDFSEAPDFKTPLMELAGMRNHTPEMQRYIRHMATVLLNHGANARMRSSNGRTALHWAVRWGNSALAVALIPQSDLTQTDRAGRTAKAYAMERLDQVSEMERRHLVRMIRLMN